MQAHPAPLTIEGKSVFRIYLSGKISGLADFGKELFSKAAAHLRKTGAEVMNPGENAFGDTSRERGYYMTVDLDYVINAADVIAVLPNWKDSVGARTEVLAAQECGKSVVHADSLKPVHEVVVTFALNPNHVEEVTKLLQSHNFIV